MRYTLDDDFFKKTVFFITAPVLAVMLAVLAKGRQVEHCVLVTHPNYTDSYLMVMENILENTDIKHMHRLSIPFFYTAINNKNFMEAYNQIKQCNNIINNFDEEFFGNKLFIGKYNLVCHFYCPVVSLRNPPVESIYVMDHGPADSLCRMRTSGEEIEGGIKERVNSFVRRFRGVSNIHIKLFRAYLNMQYPYIFKLNSIKRGFSNSKVITNDTFMFVDLREYEFAYNISRVGLEIKNEIKKTLLLVDHPKMFEDLDEIYCELTKIDWLLFLTTIVRRHIDIDETIIFKTHPNMPQKLGVQKTDDFLKKLKDKLYGHGYKKIVIFNDLFKDQKKIEGFPIEPFVGEFGINKIVGDYSSVHVIVSQWRDKNIRIISDCNGCKSMEKIRSHSKRLNNEYLEMC